MSRAFFEGLERAILDLAGDAFLLIGENGVVRSANDAAVKALDRAAAEIIGRPIGELLPSFDSAAAGDAPQLCEVAGRDGARVALEAHAAPTTSDGRLVALRPAAGSEKGQLGELAALLESQRTLKAIVDSTTAVIYVKDVEGHYILINRRFEELFHVASETARGKPDTALFPRATADAVRANDLAVLAAGCPLEFEETVPHDDGPHTYISIKFPLHRASGEIYGVCGISTDITARKRAEAELEATRRSLERLVDERTADLRESNLRLQAEVREREDAVGQLQRLIDTADEGIWVCDATATTTFANARMAELLGTTTEDLIGRPIFDFMDDQGSRLAEASLALRWRGIPDQLDFEFHRKDGRRIWTHLSSNAVRDREGNVVGALAMVTDISERKRAEQYQQMLTQELDHRVKNTLATVTALADLTMERSRSLAEFRESFSRRVQAMARTHEALARVRWQDMSFNAVVATVLAPLASGHAARIVAEGDAVRVSAHTMTPLALALNELATNALKHGALSSPGGGVRIHWQSSPDGAFVLLWTEVGGADVDRAPHTGTGLQLIRGLIEHELEGELEVSFGEGGFSCRIALPPRSKRSEATVATAPRIPRDEARASRSRSSDGLEGVRAIIVEDNFAVANSLGWLLESYGCEVVGTAGTVLAGCRLVDTVEFDVAVLDISLGDADVADVARKVQDRQKRIIYLTGYAGADRLPAELRSHPCLAKPVQAPELVAVMRDDS